jgi:hypothetical protein
MVITNSTFLNLFCSNKLLQLFKLKNVELGTFCKKYILKDVPIELLSGTTGNLVSKKNSKANKSGSLPKNKYKLVIRATN